MLVEKKHTYQHPAITIPGRRTKYKQITACFQFEPDYPKTRALIELKSRHISDKLLQGLTKLCEEQADKFLGKPQVGSFLSQCKCH